MKSISCALKIIISIYVICIAATVYIPSFNEIILFLSIAAVNIYKEKYNNSSYVLALSFILICGITYMNSSFGIMLSISAFDFANNKNVPGISAVVISNIYFIYTNGLSSDAILLCCICALFGFIMKIYTEKEDNLRISIDKERRLRYELEQTKNKLLNSSKEIAHLTEVSERNRIAREIHDSVGHRTAGVLIELQAAYKLMDKDFDKSKITLHKSITALSETLTLLRDTVHNIKPNENLGVHYIEDIVNNFSFCPINFKFTGNFSKLNSNCIELIGTNIKEALTNSLKYSKCTEVSIFIEINEVYVRLYVKDNGIGCSNIKEGLGLSGMRERVNSMGGSISISSEDGFMIVCIIPLNNKITLK